MMISVFWRSLIYRQVATVFCIFILAAAYPDEMAAATNRGVHFEDEMILGGNQLTLQGIGVLKWKYVVKVYLVGLYKPAGVSVNQVLQDVPKRLEYYFFVDMKASDFQDTGFQLMAQNVGEQKARSLIQELETFNSFYRDVKAGQRYVFTYIPGQGLEMELDGKVLGKVKGAEFAAAYMSIWLGPEPVSRGLQEGLFDPSTRME
ncbi:chalcone isomerase family protein [Thermodesulfobacteriota bacterium]